MGVLRMLSFFPLHRRMAGSGEGLVECSVSLSSLPSLLEQFSNTAVTAASGPGGMGGTWGNPMATSTLHLVTMATVAVDLVEVVG